MSKLNLKTVRVQSFVTSISTDQARDVLGGTSPYVCITDPNHTADPNGCLSHPQLVCDDTHGHTHVQATC